MTRKPRTSPSRLAKQILCLLLLATAAVALAACSESSDSSGGDTGGSTGGGSSSGKSISAGWLFYGPKDDGGWNIANWKQTLPALEQEFGDSYTQREVDNVPYTKQATQLAQDFVTGGSNVLVDVVGLGEMFTSVCEENTEINCIQTAPVSKLPPNTTGYWAPAQIPEYIAGVAAGLETESNTVGYIAAYDLPLLNGGVNSFTMGCRSVNPQCTVRVVFINDYFNPPKTTQAAETLIDAGADVLRGWTDDPSYCSTAKQRGVKAVPDFSDAASQCGAAIITSTVWNFEKYFVEQMKAISDGSFKSVQRQYVAPEDVFSLGTFGSGVSPENKEEIEAKFEELVSGSLEPFVGPIEDSSGKVRVPKGEKLSDDFIYEKWEWNVPGVVRSGG